MSATSSRALRTTLPDVASVLVLMVSAWLVFTTFDDFAISWDEPVHLSYGNHIVDWLETQGEDDSALHFRRDYLYGGGFDGLGALARRYSVLDPYDTLHLLGGLIGLLGLIGVWRLGRFLGGPWGGWWSLAFIVGTPVYWGHMFFNPKDGPFAAGYIWGLYYVIRVAAAMPAVSRGLWVKLGLGLGAALCVRIAGLLVVCYLGLAVVAYGAFRGWVAGRWLEASRAWWSMGWRSAISVCIGWAGMLVFWPWAQLRPISGPFHSLSNMTHFNLHNRSFPFGGKWIRTYEAPWDYLPRLFAFKLPEVVVVALCAGGLLGAYLAFKRFRDPQKAQQSFAHGLLALGILLPPAYAIVRGSPLYDGIRHFLFLAPPICAAAGITVAWLQAYTAERRRWLSVVLVAVVLALCGRQVAVMHHMHPIEYAWFNAFSGGMRYVENRYDIDYYGGSYKEAIERLEDYLWEKEPDKFLSTTYTVRGCGPPGIIKRYFPPNFQYAKKGRFYTGFTRAKCHLQHGKFPEVARVERLGIPLNIVRDLRPEESTRPSKPTVPPPPRDPPAVSKEAPDEP
ncbi:MAG: hypothetical protein AAF500_07145 [Myxococcota bacterium]